MFGVPDLRNMVKVHILELMHEETDSDSQTYMVTSRILRLLW